LVLVYSRQFGSCRIAVFWHLATSRVIPTFCGGGIISCCGGIVLVYASTTVVDWNCGIAQLIPILGTRIDNFGYSVVFCGSTYSLVVLVR